MYLNYLLKLRLNTCTAVDGLVVGSEVLRRGMNCVDSLDHRGGAGNRGGVDLRRGGGRGVVGIRCCVVDDGIETETRKVILE